MHGGPAKSEQRAGERGESATLESPQPRGWDVIIYYREPSYELRAGERRAPFEGRFHVRAGEGCAAVERALAAFRQLEERSSVGWTRVIVGVSCLERA